MGLVKSGAVAVGPNVPFGSGGSGLYVPEIVNQSQSTLLLAHIRQTIKSTLSEIVEVPDSVFALPADTNGLLRLPLLALVEHSASPAEAAVNDTTQTLKIDFIYVQAAVVEGIADVQAYERDRLLLLQRAFVANYRQGGTANATRVTSTPFDRISEYQKQFADDAQPVSVMVLTVEFDVIEARAV